MRYALCILIICICVSARAATINAASPARDDVAAAIALASDGDTVTVPAGTAYWTTALTVSELGITLQGAGSDPITGTVIVDENPVRSSYTLAVINWSQTNTGNMFRLTGFRFRGGVTNTASTAVGLIRLNGSNNLTNNSAWRIDHCYWELPKGRPIQIRAWAGLIDNNSFEMGTAAGISFDCRMVSTEKGDRSWANPVLWGTTNAGVYFEGNSVTSSSVRAITDGFAGAKYVVRFNTLINRAVENHGTESTQRPRGGRAMEIYGNTITLTTSPGEYATLFRSGTGLVFSNTIVGLWPGLTRMTYYLSTDGYQPWRQANGTNVWDLNVGGGPFATGTHTGANDATVLTDSTATWVVDQWKGYSVQNLDRFFDGNGAHERLAGLITGNTATTITCAASITAARQIKWYTGDRYEVWKVDKALDAPGRGEGALLSGGSDTVPPTPTTWPAQIDSPIYAWENTGKTNMASGDYPVIEGRDYIMGTPGFAYTPLVYPHPLAGGTPPPPPPPPPPPIPDQGPAKPRRRVVIFDAKMQPRSALLEQAEWINALNDHTLTTVFPSDLIAERFTDFSSLADGGGKGFLIYWKE